MKEAPEVNSKQGTRETADATAPLTAPADSPASSAQPQADAAAPPTPSLEALAAERDRLAEENTTLSDQYMRARADFDNLRKRADRDRKEYYQLASMEVVGELLPVMDALERALAAHGGNDEFRAGIQLIARQLWDTLTRLGLEPMDTRGQKFDPHLHQAIERVETDEHEDQTILEEWQRGYLFKKRLLRPALVKVAVQRKLQ